MGEKNENNILQKLGFHDYNYNPNNQNGDEMMRFLKPTSGLYSIGRKGSLFKPTFKLISVNFTFFTHRKVL